MLVLRRTTLSAGTSSIQSLLVPVIIQLECSVELVSFEQKNKVISFLFRLCEWSGKIDGRNQ